MMNDDTHNNFRSCVPLLLLLFGGISAQCPAENSTASATGQTIEWPAVVPAAAGQAITNVHSAPLCLNDERFLLARNCSADAGGWQPRTGPQCAYTQPSFEDADKCPPGYASLRTAIGLCVQLTDEQPWNDTCLPAGSTRSVLDLGAARRQLVLELLRERGVRRVWMPARRRQPYGPVSWTLPGKLFGEAVRFADDDDTTDADADADDNQRGLRFEPAGREMAAQMGCLTLSANGRSAAIERCELRYPILCVYDALEDAPVLRLACPTGFVTTRHAGALQGSCFATQRVHELEEADDDADDDDDDVDSTENASELPSTRQRRSQSRIKTDVNATAASATPPPYNWVESECRGQLYSLDSVTKTALYERFSRSAKLSASDRCLIGVLPNVLVENRTHWRSLAARVPFVNWAAPVDWWPQQQQQGQRRVDIVTADRHGRWHWSGDFSCIACQRSVQLRQPRIELRFYAARLYAVVYDGEFLWRERDAEPAFRCFTDADGELVRAVRIEGEVSSGRLLRGEQTTRRVYELRTYGDGPGGYWCEGHAMPAMRAVRSVPVVAQKHEHRGAHVFAVLVRQSCRDCRLYAQNRGVKELAQRFKAELNRLRRQAAAVSVESVRVMRMVEIDVRRNFSDVLFHVMLALNDKSDVEDDDDDDDDDDSAESPSPLDLANDAKRIFRLRHHLRHMLRPTVLNRTAEFRFRWLNSTEICLPERASTTNTDDLHWVSARLGETAAPLELCLLPNGLPVRRYCIGDRVFGCRWRNTTRALHANCAAHGLSPITRSLFEINRTFREPTATSGVIQNVTQLIESTDHARLIPADLFYLGRVMQTVIIFNQLNDDVANAAANANDGVQIATDAPLTTTTTTTTTTTVTPPDNDDHFSPIKRANELPLLMRAESENIFTIYNRLMFLDENTTRLSAALNSTNVLLDALDHIVNGMGARNLLVAQRRPVDLSEHSADGMIVMRTAKLLVFVIDPAVRNVSGVALMRRKDAHVAEAAEEDFNNYDVQLLRTDQTADALLSDGRLEAAAFVPAALLQRLHDSHQMEVTHPAVSAVQQLPQRPLTFLEPPAIRIVITMYYNDLLFQEFRRTTHAKPNGKIISVSIPGHGPILPARLPIFIRATTHDDDDVPTADACGYWNFRADTWSSDGCEFGGQRGGVVMCACSHLTHFAYLIMGTYFHSFADGAEDDVERLQTLDAHQTVLDLITLLGCSLSLAGCVGIGVTALVFPAWREKANSKVLLHLCAAIALQMVLLCFVNTEVRTAYLFANQQWLGCVMMGALLHYAVLVAFGWMLITAYLQFMRYVRVIGHQRSGRFLLRAALLGWGVPLVPVVLVVAIDPHSYIPDAKRVGQGICYPTGVGLYVGVVLPMAGIVLANLVIFVLVIYHILRGPDGKLRTAGGDRDLTLSQLRLSVLLFFLLGLTWIFGFCAVTHVGLVFSYLFCLTATLQGFVLFLYFVILDPVTRRLWGRMLRGWCRGRCGADANGMATLSGSGSGMDSK